jgi:hypothetical protein
MEGCAMSVHSYKLTILAQAKLKEFERRAEELQMLARGTGYRIKELEAAIEYAPDAPNIGDVEHELSRLRAVMVHQQARQSHADQLVSRLGGWLRELSPNAELIDARPAKLATQKGETIAQAVDRIRQAIEAHKAELIRVKLAKPPVAELKERARDYVRGLARLGKPSIVAGYDDKFKVTFATGADTPMMNVAHMLAWYDEKAFAQRLEAEIDQMPKPTLTLTATERSERWATLQSELSALERSEERLIESAADDGQEIPRRTDADPQAVLCVAQKTKVASVA